MKPRLLDLFCGAGGAAQGYANAGFEVVGVDIESQPNYPFEFVQADAIKWLEREWLAEPQRWEWGLYDAIHASPPCQAYTGMNRRWAVTRNGHPDLIDQTRALLEQTGLPWVIENVGGAIGHMRSPVTVCGRSLGLPIHRHRLFESNVALMVSGCQGGRDPFGVYGKLDGRRLWTRADGSELRAAETLDEAAEAMGIDWMTWDELREAIPPAYTEHIGQYLLAHITAQRSGASKQEAVSSPNLATGRRDG